MDKIRNFKVTIGGDRMLMHNGQLADPLNPWTKELKTLTSKRKKSDSDHEEIGRVEFQGGLYFEDKLGPYLPGLMIDAALIGGARKKKLGKSFESCVRTVEDAYKLNYDGPRTRDGLWKDRRFVDRRGCGVQQSRVMRTRPAFHNWSVDFTIQMVPGDLNPENLRDAITDAGLYVGIGDFRPRFGLFTLDKFAEI